jgi:hypothetical protein
MRNSCCWLKVAGCTAATVKGGGVERLTAAAAAAGFKHVKCCAQRLLHPASKQLLEHWLPGWRNLFKVHVFDF